MIKLLKLEFRKLFRHKSTYILLAVQFAMLFLNELINKITYDFLGEFSALFSDLPASGVKYMLAAIGAGSSSAIILGIFVALFACEDRSNDVLKNIYARGYSPTQVLLAEYLCVAAFAVFFALFSFVSGFLFGTLFFGAGSGFTGKTVLLLLLQIVAVLAYTGMFYMFPKILLKTGSSIALNILAPVGVELLFMLLNLAVSSADYKAELTKYSIGGVISTASSMEATSSEIGVAFVIVIAYFALFSVISYLVTRKRSA